jgi:hypothetical protein
MVRTSGGSKREPPKKVVENEEEYLPIPSVSSGVKEEMVESSKRDMISLVNLRDNGETSEGMGNTGCTPV